LADGGRVDTRLAANAVDVAAELGDMIGNAGRG
jgi:hypothetical protein